jgi:hypothetical protein
MNLPAILDHVLSRGFPPLLDARAAPRLFPIVIGGLVLVLLIALLRIVFSRKDSFAVRLGLTYRFSTHLGIESLVLVIEALAIYAVWVAYSTPVDRLFQLPPVVPVRVLAVIVHAVLAVGGALLLVAVLLEVFNLSDRDGGRWFAAALSATCLLVVFGWEVQHWPMLFLVIGEFLVFWYGIRTLVTALITDPSQVLNHGVTTARTLVVDALVRIVGTASIILLHPLVEPFLGLGVLITLAGVYLLLIQVDDLAFGIAVWSSRGAKARLFVDRKRMPRRGYITAGLVLFGVLLGGFAAPALAALPRTLNPTATSDLWLKASVAAAVFLVFHPLAQWAAAATLERAEQELPGQLRPIAEDEIKKKRGGGARAVAFFAPGLVSWWERDDVDALTRSKVAASLPRIVKTLPYLAFVIFCALLSVDVLSRQLGLTITEASAWITGADWTTTLIATRLPFLFLSRGDRPLATQVLGPMNEASVRIVGFVGLASYALKFAQPGQADDPVQSFIQSLGANQHFLLVLQRIHTEGWIAGALVIVGYVVYLLTMYSSRSALLSSVRPRQSVPAVARR